MGECTTGAGRSRSLPFPFIDSGLAGCYLPTFPPVDAVSWAGGHLNHPDTPPNIYEGGLGAQQEECPGVQGSKPKNFRLRHLQSLALYLPGHMHPSGQGESHLQGQPLAGDCLPQPEDSAWPLNLPQGTESPGNSPCSALREAQMPRNSLGNTGELC